MPKNWQIPTNSEAASSGIDRPEVVWEALGQLRNNTFKFWPDSDAIDATLILSHAAWWLSYLKEDHGEQDSS